MNRKLLHNRFLLTSVLALFFISLQAQVGINTITPSDGAMLDIESGTKGILIPRVDITDLSTIAPITGGSTESLLVYNTNTTTGKGFYFWDGTEWVILNSPDWKQGGNSGTTPGTGAGQNFVGTSDDTDLVVARNNEERVRFTEDDVVFNDPQNDVNFRVSTTGGANTVFVDGANDNVGIGTATPNGVFEMNSSTMGMVPPRVLLTSTLVEAPVVNPQGGSIVAGTCVYNTNTAGTAPNNVAPGLYFWNGSRWVAFAGSPGGLDWTLTGNSGTTAGTHFLGTTDNVALEVFTNNTSRARFEEDGQTTIGFGGTGANAGYTVNVGAIFTNGTALGGFANGTGSGIYGQNTSGTGRAVYGLSNIDGGNGGRFGNVNNSATAVGLTAFQGSSSVYLPGTGASSSGRVGVGGFSTLSTGTGIVGAGNGRLTVVTDTRGSGISGTGDVLGVYGYAGLGGGNAANYGNSGGRFTLDADNDVTTTTGNNADRAEAILAGYNNVTPDGTLGNQPSYFGGYFSGGSQGSGTPSYAYAGMRYNTNVNGTSGTDYKIIGTGTNSTIINDENEVPRIMFSPEAPEIVFQDYGVGQLVNGTARIDLDPTLTKNIRVDAQHPLKVFVTLEGNCNGIYVTDKSASGFTVNELQNGTSNVPFSWQIVANREDTKNRNGAVTSRHVGLRLPVGPGPIKSLSVKAETLTESKDQDNVLAEPKTAPNSTASGKN